ncbi:MAG: hypothetical protein J0I06_28055 [Planctomycetes bacterium]|nr:hypothetical protein [Planctomycetota bacterium]
MIELTKEQALALERQQAPLQLVDPRTREVYVLVRKDVYDLACIVVDGGKGKVWDDEADNDLIRKDA